MVIDTPPAQLVIIQLEIHTRAPWFGKLGVIEGILEQMTLVFAPCLPSIHAIICGHMLELYERPPKSSYGRNGIYDRVHVEYINMGAF